MIFQNFLKPFREHHVDPTSITRHDFVETNSYNFAVLIPFLAHMLRKFWSKSVEEIGIEYNWTLFTFWLGLFVAYTNQVSRQRIDAWDKVNLSTQQSWDYDEWNIKINPAKFNWCSFSIVLKTLIIQISGAHRK